MKKKHLLLILIFILAGVVVYLYFSGKKTLHNQNSYTMDLDANYTAKEMWTYTFSDDGIIEVKDSEYIEGENGAKGKQHFEFIGLKKGTVTIIFECKNLETSDAIKQEKVTLVVDKKLTIKKK